MYFVCTYRKQIINDSNNYFVNFSLTSYFLLLSEENIVFLSKERYVNLQLKEIKSLVVKQLQRNKIEMKITANEEEFLLYTNVCNLDKIKYTIERNIVR
ncbi:hypothetical protein JCM19376_41090 [Fusibacter bizertensis]